MDVIRKDSGEYRIVHAGREIDRRFETQRQALGWADRYIDDQLFDTPNAFCPPLPYCKAGA